MNKFFIAPLVIGFFGCGVQCRSVDAEEIVKWLNAHKETIFSLKAVPHLNFISNLNSLPEWNKRLCGLVRGEKLLPDFLNILATDGTEIPRYISRIIVVELACEITKRYMKEFLHRLRKMKGLKDFNSASEASDFALKVNLVRIDLRGMLHCEFPWLWGENEFYRRIRVISAICLRVMFNLALVEPYGSASCDCGFQSCDYLNVASVSDIVKINELSVLKYNGDISKALKSYRSVHRHGVACRGLIVCCAGCHATGTPKSFLMANKRIKAMLKHLNIPDYLFKQDIDWDVIDYFLMQMRALI
ncbi:hypothetical protein HOD08_04135 [bacterium]|nr:hypothetical protein [bacterium]